MSPSEKAAEPSAQVSLRRRRNLVLHRASSWSPVFLDDVLDRRFKGSRI